MGKFMGDDSSTSCAEKVNVTGSKINGFKSQSYRVHQPALLEANFNLFAISHSSHRPSVKARNAASGNQFDDINSAVRSY